MKKIKVLDLFSGIGGFSLSLESTGFFETVAFCEIDPFCQQVLKKHWPDTPIFEDVKKLNRSDIDETIELICGGFPCQPFSVAGQRRGAADDRFLWPEMFRLIKEFRPAWVIGENVAGFVSLELDKTLFDLESADYKARAFVLPALSVDAPHRRDRCFIVAHSDQDRLQRSATERGTKTPTACKGASSSERLCQSKSVQSSTDTGSRGLFGASVSNIAREKSSDNCGNSERNRKNIWPVEPGICRVANGVPNRVDRIAALGNAVVPQIVTEIGYAILEVEKILNGMRK